MSEVTSTGDEVGVGPWQGEWPTGHHWDPELLREGDRRNVVDAYRYWRLDAIVADLDTHRHDFHVAVENWGHDFNIGSVIRTANAFNAKAFHIVGKRRWNRRGAMVTDRYQHEHHHPTVEDLVAWAATAGTPATGAGAPRTDATGAVAPGTDAPGTDATGADDDGQPRGIPLIGIDNLPGSLPLETHDLPRECVLVFGQEGPGLSAAMREACEVVLHIEQFGSTRSINAGAAAAIAMHAWVRRNVFGQAVE